MKSSQEGCVELGLQLEPTAFQHLTEKALCLEPLTARPNSPIATISGALWVLTREDTNRG